MKWASVGDQKLALRVVVFVVAGSAREQERPLHVPPRIGAELESGAGKERLSRRVLCALHSPRPQIFRQRRYG